MMVGRSFLSSGLVLLLGCWVVGCAPSILTVERVSFNPPVNTATDGGLTLEITALGVEEMSRERTLSVEASGGRWIIATPPTIRVKVANANEHIVRFTGAVIKLADKDRNLFDVLGRDMLLERHQALAVDPSYASALPAILPRVNSLRMLDQSAEILPGFSGIYYLVFATPFVSEPEFNQWVAAHAPFNLMLFDVITATDEAGQVSRKSRFEFPIPAYLTKQTAQGGKIISSERIATWE